MGDVKVYSGGKVTAQGYANNQAVSDYVAANGGAAALPAPGNSLAKNTALSQAIADVGAKPPPDTKSASSYSGVQVPQQTGPSNPPLATSVQGSTAPAASPNTSGGTAPNSAYAVAPTPKAEQKAASSGDSTVSVAGTFPTVGYVSPQVQETLDKLMADFYRDGKLKTEPGGLVTQETLPKMIDPWDGVTASIRVFGFKPKGGAAGTANAGQDVDHELVPAYTKFILEGVTEQHNERSQIVETFGDFYVFLFGARPPMYQFQGTLINTRNVNWVSDFHFYYENYLRGTKCVESSARLLLTYGGRQIEGFMLGMTTATDAGLEAGVKVSFPVVVTRKTFLGFSDDFGSLVVGGNVMKDETFTALLDKIAGKEGKGTSDKGASDAAGAALSAMTGGSSTSPISKFQ